MDPNVPDPFPLKPGGRAGLPVAMLVSVSGGVVLDLEYVRRKAAASCGLNVYSAILGRNGPMGGGFCPDRDIHRRRLGTCARARHADPQCPEIREGNPFSSALISLRPV